MKKLLVLISALSVSIFAAEPTLTLKDVHLCCDACVKGAEKSIKDLKGVTFKADKDAETVTLTAADKASLQKAADAMAAGGYYGKSDSDIKPVAKTGAKNTNVKSIIVAGAHMCCPGCVKAVDRAIKETPGATGHTAKKGSVTFVVNGDFNDQKFFEALQKEGLNGHVTDKEVAPGKAENH